MRFSKKHCWIRKKESSVLIGITEFAANRICDNFELFLCDEGDIIRSGESIGEINGICTEVDWKNEIKRRNAAGES